MHPPLAQPECTLRMHCTVSQAWPGRVASLALAVLQAWPLSCRGAHPGPVACIGSHIIARTRALAHRDTNIVSRPWPPVARRVVAHPVPYRRASCAVSQPCCAVSRPKGCLTQPRYKILYRDLRQPGHARVGAIARLARRPAVLWPVSWPYHAVSWAWPGRIMAPTAVPTALCHDTIHCIVTQMGSSPSSRLLSRLFFHSFSFSFVLLEDHPKKCFFFIF